MLTLPWYRPPAAFCSFDGHHASTGGCRVRTKWPSTHCPTRSPWSLSMLTSRFRVPALRRKRLSCSAARPPIGAGPIEWHLHTDSWSFLQKSSAPIPPLTANRLS